MRSVKKIFKSADVWFHEKQVAAEADVRQEDDADSGIADKNAFPNFRTDSIYAAHTLGK